MFGNYNFWNKNENDVGGFVTLSKNERQREVTSAYHRLKAYIYYDTTDLILRGKLVKFDYAVERDKELEKLTNHMNK